jgi:Ca-activated chloride channel family protein
MSGTSQSGGAVAALALLLVLLGGGMDPFQTLYRQSKAARAAFEERRFEDAVEGYRRALELAPEDPRLHFNLGNALARAGRLEEAERAWRRAAEGARGPLRTDALYNRGVAALEAGDVEAAIARFTDALLVDPLDAEARRNLRIALERRAEREDAETDPAAGGERPQEERLEKSSEPQEDRSAGDATRDPAGERGDRRRDEPRRARAPDERAGRERPRREPNAEGRAPEGEAQGAEEERRSGRQARRSESAGSEAGAAAEREAEASGLRDADREMALRLLERLSEREKEALERALERRARSRGEPQGGKDW